MQNRNVAEWNCLQASGEKGSPGSCTWAGTTPAPAGAGGDLEQL